MTPCGVTPRQFAASEPNRQPSAQACPITSLLTKDGFYYQAALILDPRCVPCWRRAQGGAEFWASFLRNLHAFLYLHAIVRWAWSNFLHGSSSPGLCNARVNFDVTGVCLFQDSKSGHMVAAARAHRSSHYHACARSSRCPRAPKTRARRRVRCVSTGHKDCPCSRARSCMAVNVSEEVCAGRET